MKIRTYTHPIRRTAAWLWEASERHPGIMLTLIVILLSLVNVVEQAP